MAEPISIPSLPSLPNGSLTLDILTPVEHPDLGTVKLTGDQSRNLYAPIQAIPAHASLNDSHEGLIITSVGGQAKVATVSGGIPAAAGKWSVEVKTPILAPPTLAEHRLKLTANPSDGEVFTLFGKEFTFVSGTPVGVRDIQIGATNTDTLQNMATVINAYGTANSYYYSVYLGADTAVYAGPVYAGIHGNDAGFTTGVSALTCTLQVTAADKDLANVNDVILTWQKNDGATYNVTVGDICDPSVPNGILLGGYMWPATSSEAAENLQYALSHKLEFYSDFTAGFTGSVVEIVEHTPPVTAVTVLLAASSHNYELTIEEYSTVAKAPYVKDLILGVLSYIRDGKACFSPSILFRAKLSSDSAPVVFDTDSAKPSPRILSYADGGCVKVGFEFDYNEETYYGNGFLMALEQGTPGQTILVQRTMFIGG